MKNLALKIDKNDLEELQKAKELLENPGIAIKLSVMIGNPIQKGLEALPKNWNEKLSDITKTSLLKAADAAIFTIKDNNKEKSNNLMHKIAVGATGTIGGIFGLSGLAVELPLTTTIILRSIADIARSQGESVKELDTKLACLEVFALGGNSVEDDNIETSYYTSRAFLANTIAQTNKFVAQNGVFHEGTTVFLNVIGKVAERFGIQVTEKTIAQSVPVIGAAGGALINTLFITHFQDMAKGHFTIRKLERKYNKELIQQVYEQHKKV
ncbi:EcsC family protein [uncultured Tenacibaculum sp.]|uniref:EcsC family protein n=1 Tax=uncultured Tenacibaculum sp. TaxID=174713 RepID=UPI002614D596|nr:EcsC family protein [uncultured Tenacibaculum sp.]